MPKDVQKQVSACLKSTVNLRSAGGITSTCTLVWGGPAASSRINYATVFTVLKHGLWATTIWAPRYRESSEVVPKALLLR